MSEPTGRPVPPLEPRVSCDICPWPATRRLMQHVRDLSAFQVFFGVKARVAYTCELHLADAVEYVRTGIQPRRHFRRRGRNG
jgi:hypothetical protein